MQIDTYSLTLPQCPLLRRFRFRICIFDKAFQYAYTSTNVIGRLTGPVETYQLVGPLRHGSIVGKAPLVARPQ